MSEETSGFPVTSSREIKLLLSLRHKHVIPLVEVVVGEKQDSVFLVFEFCEFDLDKLNKHFVSKGSVFPLSDLKCVSVQILKGLLYVHQNYVLHRDVKLNNILVNLKGEVKLADFGLSRSIGRSSDLTPKVCTLWNRAPEILLKCPDYGPAADVWLGYK